MLPDFETIRTKFPEACQQSDGSISLHCSACALEGRPAVPFTIYKNGACSCPRYAAIGRDENRAHVAAQRAELGLGNEPAPVCIEKKLLDGTLTIEVSPAERNRQLVVARNCTRTIHRDILTLDKDIERARFINALGLEAAARREVHDAFLNLAERFTSVMDAVEEEQTRSSAATLLVKLSEQAVLIHAPDGGDGFAILGIDGHKETWPLRSKGFKRWLARLYYTEYEKTPGSQAMQDGLAVIEAKAVYEGPERQIFIRVGELNGKIYIDLADDEWRAVEIDAEGWRVVATPPVEFRRPKGMLSLPLPTRGGSVDELRPFFRPADDEQWALMLASLVMKFRPRGPFPIDVLTGGQGAGKSTIARVVRQLVDPSVAAVRSEPREVRDLQIAATNEWLPVLDNLSRLPVWLSDALCCLSTGSALRTRELYSDSEESIFATMRPVMLTSIEEVATQADLLDRCIIFTLQDIDKRKRMSEKVFWREFEKVRPGILGALFDAVSLALKNEDSVVIDESSRMADFEQWAVAAEPALGVTPGTFLRAYRRNQDQANSLALESSPISDAILALVREEQTWTGTAAGLLDRLMEGTDEAEKRKRKDSKWPATARAVSGILRRIAPNLRRQGVVTEFDIRDGRKRTRLIKLTWLGPTSVPEFDDTQDLECKTPSAPSAPSAASETAEFEAVTEPLLRTVEEKFASAHRPQPSATESADGRNTTADGVRTQNAEPTVRVETTDETEVADEKIAADGADEKIHHHSLVALDTETTGLERDARMIGLAISHDGEQAIYETDSAAWPMLMPEPEQTVIFHNAKFDLAVLERTSLPLPDRWEDTLIAAHLINENEDHGLKPLAVKHLGIEKPLTFKEADQMRLLDPKVFDEYARNDARYTFQLWQEFEPELKRQGLERVYELEKSLLPVVRKMEKAGMLFNIGRMSELSKTVNTEIERTRQEIFDHAGKRFELNSPQRTAAILYDKLGIPCRKKTKKESRSVDEDALESVRGYHPIVDAILRYRELDTLASKFLNKLPIFADETGRIHPDFKQLGAVSGRFSCAAPNVQGIPSRSELGTKLRQAFIAAPGMKLCVADYSQMELRILCHYSQDPLLLAAYNSGEAADLHTLTASKVFGKAEAEVTKNERSIAKTINFSIAFGTTPRGLFNQLRPKGINVTEKECERFVADYFKAYAGVGKFLNEVALSIRRLEYVKSIFGRRRRVAGLTHKEMRQGKNFVIQATGADIAKDAMVRLDAALPEGALLIGMVHDELIVECPEEQAEVVRALMVDVMQKAPDGFTVPLLVEAKVADNWGDAK